MLYLVLFLLAAGAAAGAYGEAKYGQKLLAKANADLLAAKTELSALKAKL